MGHCITPAVVFFFFLEVTFDRDNSILFVSLHSIWNYISNNIKHDGIIPKYQDVKFFGYQWCCSPLSPSRACTPLHTWHLPKGFSSAPEFSPFCKDLFMLEVFWICQEQELNIAKTSLSFYSFSTCYSNAYLRAASQNSKKTKQFILNGQLTRVAYSISFLFHSPPLSWTNLLHRASQWHMWEGSLHTRNMAHQAPFSVTKPFMALL